MKNCKNCASNDRIDIAEYRVCQHCGTRTRLKKKEKQTYYGGGGYCITFLEPLLERYDVGYQTFGPTHFIKFIP